MGWMDELRCGAALANDVSAQGEASNQATPHPTAGVEYLTGRSRLPYKAEQAGALFSQTLFSSFTSLQLYREGRRRVDHNCQMALLA
jgi:hypothetical protein